MTEDDRYDLDPWTEEDWDYVVDHIVNFVNSYQGAAPNPERGKCSTDTTGKPIS